MGRTEPAVVKQHENRFHTSEFVERMDGNLLCGLIDFGLNPIGTACKWRQTNDHCSANGVHKNIIAQFTYFH